MIDLVHLLRNNTHMGRLSGSEVREALAYMQSIGLLVPEGSLLNPPIEAPAGYAAAPPDSIAAWVPVSVSETREKPLAR